MKYLLLRRLGSTLVSIPLLLEDMMNPTQLPKIEVREDYVFIILKILDY